MSMAFAFALLQQRHQVLDCEILAEDPGFEDRRLALQALLV
jgi:CO dehydrogenase/acetyl-CoA synthase gamma subunit (corrinoid Fe-S protein)